MTKPDSWIYAIKCQNYHIDFNYCNNLNNINERNK